MNDKSVNPSVALFTCFEWVSISTSVLNTAKYLASKGYDVDLFAISSERFGVPVFDHENVHVHIITSGRFPIPFFKFLMRYIYITRRNHSFFIGFDPEGLIIGGLVSLLFKVFYIYHSLEIYTLPENTGRKHWYGRLRKKLEKWFAQRARLILTQDENRANILAHIDNLDRGRIFLVYNSPMGEALSDKSTFLRRKLGISDNKKVVLCVGSLMPETFTDEIIRSVDNWPEEFVLVVHGWIPSVEFERSLRREAEQRTGKVFLSTELLPDSDKNKLFQSADIGLAFFKPVDKNLEYAAGAAGKIYDFMRAGVPVIGNSIPGMRELLEENELGLVVSEIREIGGVLRKIICDYYYYSQGALKSYGKYRFEVSYARVLDKVQTL